MILLGFFINPNKINQFLTHNPLKEDIKEENVNS